jgi:hypothetical protein
VGYITLSKLSSSRINCPSLDVKRVCRDLFPTESNGGLGLRDLPPTIRPIIEFIGGSRSGVALRMVSRKGVKAQLNYDLEANEFNQSYWVRNFIKCLIVSRFAKQELNSKPEFIDVGGGIGPFALALVEVAARTRITIHDASIKQEQIFRRLQKKGLIPSQISFVRKKIGSEFLNKSEIPRLYSYVLCENENLVSNTPQILQVVGNFALVVDYWQIVEPLAKAARSAGLYTSVLKNLEVRLDAELAQIIGQDIITISGGVFKNEGR